MPDPIPYMEQPRPSGDRLSPTRVIPAETDEATRERSAFYSSKRWAKHRRSFLAKNPLCAHCRAGGRLRGADVVHHKVERLEDPSKAWDWSNYEALCRPCHTRHHNAHRGRGGADDRD